MAKGRFTGGKIARPAIERFWEKVDKNSSESGCWNWTCKIHISGYGVFRLKDQKQKVKAHRFSYENCVGPIPNGLHLDHLCRNRACVNPAHLEPVTNRENVLRGISFSAVNSRKTHCKAGHLFDDRNTRISKKTGGRICRDCEKVTSKAYHHGTRKVRAAAAKTEDRRYNNWVKPLPIGGEAPPLPHQDPGSQA